MNRMIEVKSCCSFHCPFCTPDSYNQAVNYCNYEPDWEPLKIGRVKTFPRSCPLKKVDKSEGVGG